MSECASIVNIFLTATAITLIVALLVALEKTAIFDSKSNRTPDTSPTKASGIHSYSGLLSLSEAELTKEHDRLRYLYREGICSSPMMESRLADVRDAKHKVMIFGPENTEPARLTRQKQKITDAKFKEIKDETGKNSVRISDSSGSNRRHIALQQKR